MNNENRQFRILYRHFVYRLADPELIPAEGDSRRLLGQFAALFLFFSFWVSLSAFGIDGPRVFLMEHFLISTTMLVVGLFAVINWDATFPDLRDVLVLGPLPVRTRTVFMAKAAALTAALGAVVMALNAFTGITYPLMLKPNAIRSFAAYWIAMLLAGAFISWSLLAVQGLAAQLLSRSRFLRVSAFLQMSAFCLIVTGYFLASPAHMAWLPSYWFVGLFQQLNGTLQPELMPLAKRAWIGLAATGCAAATAFVLSYLRTLRKIVEQPEIVSRFHFLNGAPSRGNPLKTALTVFSIRTLLRSRQHRVTLAFYLGAGFALVILLARLPRVPGDNTALLVSSMMMSAFWIVGVRVVFAMPFTLRANWIFRVSAVRGAEDYLAAVRRPLFVIGAGPAWLVWAAFFLCMWPLRTAIGHLLVLGLWETIVAWICLYRFRKIPFTCSWLPGKSHFHLTFLGFLGILILIVRGAIFERSALDDGKMFAEMMAALASVALVARWLAMRGHWPFAREVLFDEAPPTEIFGLGLYRDGALPIEPDYQGLPKRTS